MNIAQQQTSNVDYQLTQGAVAWRSPSNIALVKYWGKKPGQIPANPSISFTLSNSYTDMQMQWVPKQNDSKGIQLDFYFEEQHNPKFADKIIRFLESQSPQMPWLQQLDFTIRSSNSFPHSAGIASSASSMSALALCLCTLEQELTGGLSDESAFYQKASYLARLASGSASRSVYGGLVTWGEIEGLPNTSDQYASPLSTPIHPVFKDYYDAVLIVSRGEKEVSSRAGHALMDSHPYAEARYQHARQNIQALMKAIAEGDTAQFNFIVENEALALHGLMMTSNPSVTLFKPNTWQIIQRLRTFREKTGYTICFTLDAGPNVHILYPAAVKSEVETFIKEELVVYCDNHYWIADKTGKGPSKIEHEQH